MARAEKQVLGEDMNESIVSDLHNGKISYEDPGLSEFYEEAKDNFKVSSMVEESDCFINTNLTSLDKEMKMADLEFMKSATLDMSSVIKDGNLFILNSTSPPGSSTNFVLSILKRKGAERIYYAYSPEITIPG